jgi:diadenylate cyclase
LTRVVDGKRERSLLQVLTMLAPGTTIRDGIERIIGAGRGALMVVGWTDTVERIVSGGFLIDTPATAQRIAELAKMDGALILDDEGDRILRANVHLVPDPSIPTSETGTRHRSAERTAKQTGKPVISVS